MSTYGPTGSPIESRQYPQLAPPPKPKRNELKWLLLGGAVVLLTLMGTCIKKVMHAGGLSDTATAEFHKRLNAEEYAQIIAAAAPEFSTAPGPDVKEFLGVVHRKMGTFVSTSRGNVTVKGTPGEVFVVATYDSVFAEGKAQETFTWRKHDEELKLVGYNIQSPMLVMK